MKKLSKINLKDISDKQSLNVDQLSKIVGGASMELYAGCKSGICNNNRDYGATKYCDDAVCESGIGVCNEST